MYKENRTSISCTKEDVNKLRAHKMQFMAMHNLTQLSDIKYCLITSQLVNQAKQLNEAKP